MKKKGELEFRYYELPQGDNILPLLGEKWTRPYGTDPVSGNIITCQHFHNLMEIGYCIKGQGELTLDGKTIPYSDGLLSIIPANFPHNTHSFNSEENSWEFFFIDPPALLLDIYPSNQIFIDEICSKLNKRARVWRLGENDKLVALVRLIMDECRSRERYSIESVKGLLLSLIMQTIRAEELTSKSSDSSPDKYNRINSDFILAPALQYIDRNFSSVFKIEYLANLCGLSETHFRRVFSKYMNMSPVEYINQVRIKNACELIEKTSFSIEHIAERSGFSSMSTFNRNFKRVLDLTPYQFKKDENNYKSKILDMKVRAKKGW